MVEVWKLYRLGPTCRSSHPIRLRFDFLDPYRDGLRPVNVARVECVLDGCMPDLVVEGATREASASQVRDRASALT